jgi:hypothetical protein
VLLCGGKMLGDLPVAIRCKGQLGPLVDGKIGSMDSFTLYLTHIWMA